jgi:cytochrome c553
MNMLKSTLSFGILGTCTVLAVGLAAGKNAAVYGAERKAAAGAKTAPQNAAAAPASTQKGKAAAAPQVKAVAAPMVSEQAKFFDDHVRPVLTQNCYKCHTDEESGGLRVDSRAALIKGGDTGAAIVPGDPGQSLLMKAVLQTGNLKMPPRNHKLADGDIEALSKWIKDGAVWPADESAKPVLAALTADQAKGPAGDEYFESKVRPILAERCGLCHQARSAGGLQMISREALIKGGDSGPAIVPGDPSKSLLLQAVHQTGEIKMPPKGGKIADDEEAVLVEWVRMGAPWPKSSVAIAKLDGDKITDDMRNWWSFQPLKDPAIPTPKDANWAKTDIDKLVLAKMESKGFKPAPQADRPTLIRRATLDLTGLPPTLEEVKAFVDDKDPNAYEKVLDRLLASPRYGERWGRHWLDVARYADDDIRGLDPRGRGFMPMQGAYLYRDWVVKAMNEDLPYDKFVKMQIAGDLMEKKPTPDELTATSFLGAAPWIWDQAEPVQGRADERNERIDAVTRGYLGLTVACARCHDHKYDPILQKDYYALGGVFASSTYKEYNMVPDAEVGFYKERFDKAEKFDEESQTFSKEAGDLIAKAMAAKTSEYMVAAWQVAGKPKGKVEDVAERAKLDPEQLDRWVKFLAKKPIYYPYLKEWQMMIAQGGTQDQAKYLADTFQDLVLDLELEAKKLEEENDIIKAKSGAPTRRKKDAKPNEFDTYDEFCPGCTLELKVMTPERANLYTDLFQRSLTSADVAGEGRGDPALFSYRGWALTRRLGQAEQGYLADLQTESQKLRKELPEDYPFVHGMADKPQATDISLNIRGNPNQNGPIVPRHFLTVLDKVDDKPYTQGSGRLQLANDILATPLSSRVWVNRVWKWHFGTGIVNTADNFGKVGDPPSNPELLEYLAVQFNKDGMSLKKLQKEIMMSAVYQQSTKETAEEHEKDPDDRLYTHFPLQRLDAEQLRDSILFVAGDLDVSKMGGPAKEMSTENTRRTIYAKVSRFRIDPFLQAFDFPNPTFTAEQRFSTNVPVQRLYFMNNQFVYSQAGKLAERVFSKPDDTKKITATYEYVFAREPTPAELQLGLDFLKSTPEKPGYMVNQEPLTAWKQYTRALFSSNEFEFVN